MAAEVNFLEKVPEYIDDIGHSLPKVMSGVKDIENIFAWHMDAYLFEEDKDGVKWAKKSEKDIKSALSMLEGLVEDIKKERKYYDMMIDILEKKI